MDNKLNDTWVLWEHRKNTKNNYNQNTCKLGSFNTIKGFWEYFGNYPYPSELFYNGKYKPKFLKPEREVSSVSLFRENIDPKWEDPMNTNGGEISIRKFKNLKELDEFWEKVSIYSIGEQFNHLVTGVRIVDSSIPNKKCLYRIELWF